MKRHLLNLLTALSLPLCVAVIVLWVRSQSIGDYLRSYNQPRILECSSNDGLLSVVTGELAERRYPIPSGWEGSFWPFERKSDYYSNDLRQQTPYGFRFERWRRKTDTLTADTRIVTVPYWLLALLTVAAPVARLLGWRRQRRRRWRLARGLCAACGYDLCATPDRCPECGHTPTGATG